MQKCFKIRGKTIVCALFPLLSILVLLLFLNRYMAVQIDSDMSSEMVLSKLLAEEGGIWSENWYYSTELRVLFPQITWSLLFRFIDNWHIVRLWGTAVWYLMYLASGLYLFRQIGLSWNASLIGGGMLFLPLSHEYYQFVLLGANYISYISISFTMVAMLLHLVKTSHRHTKIILLAAIASLSFVAGLAGLRQVVVLYLPMVCVVFLGWLLRTKEEETPFERQENRLFSGTLYATVFAEIGYVINSSVLSQKMHFKQFKPYYGDLIIERIEQTFNGWLDVFGFRAWGYVASASTVYNFFCFVQIAVLVMIVTQVLCHPEKKTWGIYVVTRYVALCQMMVYKTTQSELWQWFKAKNISAQRLR